MLVLCLLNEVLGTSGPSLFKYNSLKYEVKLNPSFTIHENNKTSQQCLHNGEIEGYPSFGSDQTTC